MLTCLDTQTAYPRVQAALGALADWLIQLARPHKDDLSQIDPHEVTVIAHDLGLSEHELYVMAAQRPDSARLLSRRMSTLSLNADAINAAHPEVMRDLQRLCANCGTKRRCQNDVTKRPAARAWEQYCPNAMTLQALEREVGP